MNRSRRGVVGVQISLNQFQWKLYPYGTNQGELCSGYSVSPYHIKFLNYTHVGPTHVCL